MTGDIEMLDVLLLGFYDPKFATKGISFCGDSVNILRWRPREGARLLLDLVSKLSLTLDADSELD
jgi:hypothetical protein